MKLYINEENENRKRSAFRGHRPDRVPVDFSDQLDFLHGWIDIDCRDYHVNAATMLGAQVKFNKRFSGAGITGPNFGVALEASAFGAEILFTSNNPPWVIESCRNFDDIGEYVESLGEPDPICSGQLPLFYQTFNAMRSMTGDSLGVPLGSIASFDVASLLVGMENLSIALRLEPDIVHTLLTKINRFLIRFIEARIEYFGADSVPMLDLYGDNAGYISPEDFTEFVIPYNKEIYDYFADNDTVKLYHCDGPLSQHLNLIPDMGCNCLYSFDPTADLNKFVEIIGDKVCLVGNLDPIRVLRNGTPDVVRDEVKRVLVAGKKARSFVLSTGGELANGTPPENIDIVLEVLESHGSYE